MASDPPLDELGSEYEEGFDGDCLVALVNFDGIGRPGDDRAYKWWTLCLGSAEAGVQRRPKPVFINVPSI
jgi:hypothetical protein